MKLLELERETASGELDTCPPLDEEGASGFFCRGCLEDRDEEAGEGYCRECLDVVKADQRALGPKEFWSDDCLIYFHFGVGYALTDELHTIKLGDEADVLEALSTGQMPDSISGLPRKVLAEILEDRHGAGEASLVGAGVNRAFGRQQKTARRSTPGKRLALRFTKSKNKALLQ